MQRDNEALGAMGTLGSGRGQGENGLPHWFGGSPYTHKVARAIAQYGPVARITLARMLGLSQGALSRITSDLIYEGVIEEATGEAGRNEEGHRQSASEATGSRRGRPQTLLRLKAGGQVFIGMNLHGRQVTAVAVDNLCRALGPALSRSLPSTGPQDVADEISQIADELSRSASQGRKPVALGISIGGHPDALNRSVTHAPYLHWDDKVDLARMVEARSGIPTGIFNDMDSLLLHESWFGHGIGVPRFAMLTMGSGIGYALSENGEPVDYPDKSYGLAGHILVDPEGPSCYAGHTGCSQCLTSDSLAQEYSQAIGRTATIDDLIADLGHGSSQARTLVNRVCFRLGALIATVANFTMPNKIFIDGETSMLARMNTESIRSGINWYRPSQASKVDFRILDFSWDNWAAAAASRVIARYIG